MTRADTPVTRRDTAGAATGPATDRVRIVGAEPAGEITGELPVVQRDADPAGEGADERADRDEDDGGAAEPHVVAVESPFDQPTVHLIDEPADPGDGGPVIDPVRPGETAVPGATATPTELPHWTEPPTGQVPAVLSRDNGDDTSGSTIGAPTWREEDADWVAHEEQFDPAMFAGEEDELALGSLDETDSTDADRRPWEFDLDSSPHPTGPVQRVSAPVDDPANPTDPITEPTEVVTPTPRAKAAATAPEAGDSEDQRESPEPTTAMSSAAVAALAAERAAVGRPTTDTPTDHDDPGEELFADKPLPTGSTRLGRARRAGLLPARLRAKRPEDVDATVDTPLAAEPPGASVTEVPGAGRKRVGVAGLAAADRTAERAQDAAADESRAGAGTAEGVALAAAASTATRRRLLRRPQPAGTAPASGADEVDGPTGGGPPAPRAPRRPPADPNRPGPGGSSIGIRVGTGVAVAVVALLAFKLGTVPSVVLSAIVVTFAAGECFGVLRRAGYHPASLLGLVGTISLMVGAYAKGVAALPLVLVLITVFTLIWYLFGIERGSPVAGTAATLLTVGWVSLLGAYAGLLLSPSSFPDRHGIAFLLGAIIATVANDVGALVIGGWLGSRPLAPKISPNKTWEGLFGGAVFSILFSTVVVGSIHPWSASNAALLGVVVAVVAPIGDLCESLLKRDLGLKDMGRLLPGHGGVLDRVDALLFVLPATYYLVRALNIA